MSIGYTNSPPGLDEKNKSLIQLLKFPFQKLGGLLITEDKGKVQRLFLIEDQRKVQGILERHPLLIHLLLEAHSAIEKFFPDSQLTLNAITDPEASSYKFYKSNDNEELNISISTHLNPREAIKVLEQFYDDWWSSNSRKAKGKISIGLEFV